MEIRARIRASIVILDISGRIDVNSAPLVEAVGQCIRDGYYDILLNFEEVEFMDYMGISAIMLAYKEVVNINGRMKFVNVAAHFRNLFSMAGLDKIIEIYTDEELALNSFKEDRIIENIKRLQLRRRFRRIPIDIKVEIKDKYDSAASYLRVDTINLSGIGAYLYGSGCDKFKLGDKIVMKFRLPPKDEEIELDAKVVWLSDKQIQPHLHPGIAVEFYQIPAVLQEKLLEFIERNLSFLSTNNQDKPS